MGACKLRVVGSARCTRARVRVVWQGGKKKAEVYALCVRDLSENKLGEVHAGLCTRRVANLDEKKVQRGVQGGGGKKRPEEV